MEDGQRRLEYVCLPIKRPIETQKIAQTTERFDVGPTTNDVFAKFACTEINPGHGSVRLRAVLKTAIPTFWLLSVASRGK